MKYINKIFPFLEKEFSESIINKVSLNFFKSLEKFPSFPIEISRFDRHLEDSKFLKFSPIIVVVSILLFFSFSDHPLSYMGTLVLLLGTISFYIGTLINIPKFKKIKKSYFWPLLIIFSVIFLLSIVQIEAFGFYVKLSLLPLLLIGITERDNKDFFVSLLVINLVILSNGFWALSFPYIFISLIYLFLAYNGRAITYLEDNTYNLIFILLSLGTIFYLLDLVIAGGIPLLDVQARNSLDPTFTMMAHLFPMGAILLISYVGLTKKYTYKKARSISIFFTLLSLLLMALLGYRTQVIFVLFGALVSGAIVGIWKKSELFVMGGAAVLSLVALTIIRDVLLGVNLSLFESLITRISLTTDVMDILSNMGGLFGITNGAIHIATHPYLARLMPGVAYSPRRMIAVLVGERSVSVTSTIFGPLAIDFGVLGVISFMAFLGFFLSNLYKMSNKTNGERKILLVGLYSMVLSYTMIGIETGILDLEVILLFIISLCYLLFITNRKII
ncbi:MAG: oligosaccharide repeat unit polymerase [Candidatus Methanofastidiosa archaeon]|nr:oligosaccharide repeat unit polymerase [Candidatus Methanofastidiosa archaeon]